MVGVEVLQLVGLGVVAAVLLVTVRQSRPEMALLLSLAVAAVIFLSLSSRFVEVIRFFRALASTSELGVAYLDTVLRVIGIAYLTEFGAQVCRDAGEGAVASKVELAGKLMIVLLAVPLVAAVLDLLLRLVP